MFCLIECVGVCVLASVCSLLVRVCWCVCVGACVLVRMCLCVPET